MNHRKLIQATLVVIVLSLLMASISTIAQSGKAAELQLVTFTETGDAEPNVFIMGKYGLLWRVTPDTPISALNQPVYATTGEFRLDPLAVFDSVLGPQSGPYAVGEELGVTLEEWLHVHGTGIYAVADGTASN